MLDFKLLNSQAFLNGELIFREFLNESKIAAENLKEFKLGIYSILNCLTQIQVADEFVAYISKRAYV